LRPCGADEYEPRQIYSFNKQQLLALKNATPRFTVKSSIDKGNTWQLNNAATRAYLPGLPPVVTSAWVEEAQ
jgi:hypothetical protein